MRKAKLWSVLCAAVLLCACIAGVLFTGASASETRIPEATTTYVVGTDGGSFESMDGQLIADMMWNPDMTKEEIEDKLKEYLGVQKVIWLKSGIYNDETNEHVDNICAFTGPAEVVLAWTDDENDPQYEMSKSCYDILSESTDAKGRKFKIHKLYQPKPVTITAEECEGLDTMDFEPTRTPGERLAASYVNFYISNKAVVMPYFNDPADERAKETLQKLFPDRKIVPIYARDVLIGGGNIHCITQQIPKFR